MTSAHACGAARPVASAGGDLQRSFDKFFPLEGLSKRNGSILSRARSRMLENLLRADLARISEKFGCDAGSGNGGDEEVRRIAADGNFYEAGNLIQRLLDDHREEREADVRTLEREFSDRLERITSYVDARAGVYGELWNALYGPRATLLAKLVGY